MKTSNIEILNMIEMIGCNKAEFLELIKGYEKISMSSGSYYSDYTVFGGREIIAKYDCKGNRIS